MAAAELIDAVKIVPPEEAMPLNNGTDKNSGAEG